MRRLNVRFSQIEECISKSLFALDAIPKNPPLEVGELLLLQLVKEDAERLGKLNARIEFALVFERTELDADGSVSRAHWPNAGKVWRYIIHASETIPTAPFSLERLNLSRDYSGQGNAVHIEPVDEERVSLYLTTRIGAQRLPELLGVHEFLQTIRNHDLVVRLSPVRHTRVSEHDRSLSDPWLGDALKVLYDHRCQVCTHDFKPRYGVPFADTRFLQGLKDGGEAVSRNVVVLCPNHNAIIGATKARFDLKSFAFAFPNGLQERLLLRDHLL
jgi:hypothetical protein